MIVHNFQPTNQRLERESLHNQRCENDAERKQEDEIASGEWFAINQDKRDSQRAGKRVRPAHPGPCDQRSVLPGSAVFMPECSAQQARQIGGPKHPDKTNQDNGRNKHYRQLGHASRRTWSERVDHLRQLKPDEHEKNSIENEDDHLPNRHSLESHPSAQDTGSAPPVINASNDYREDAGDVQFFSAEVGNVWSKQREHCLNWRIVQALLQLRCQPTHGEPNTNAARGDKKKLQACLPQ